MRTSWPATVSTSASCSPFTWPSLHWQRPQIQPTPAAMPDTKQDVLDMLRDLTELTLLEEGDAQSFRVRAYENATQAIAEQANDLGRLSLKDLQKIHAVGKSTAEKVRELLETGKVGKLEALRQKYPRSLVALLRLQG